MIVSDLPRTPRLIAHDAGQIPHHSSIPSLQKSNWSETPKFALHGGYFK